ncbi:MAG: hypothetical protein V7636_761, partial [Actinomycetota bacterium]
MDADVRELFARGVGDATENHSGAALDGALVELGWHDALIADRRDAVSILFEHQGASNATSSAVGDVLLDAMGATCTGIVLPALGQWRAPATYTDDRLVVDGLALTPHDRVLVVVQSRDAAIATIVPCAALEMRPVLGIDPSLGLLQVRGEVRVADAQGVDWTAAIAGGHRAIAHELVGASRAMLELARRHALERVQFGRPIAMFQAVRHRLAETLVAIETAGAALDAAWDDESAVAAAMAKSLAGRGARTAARHCQQVLAGIGFTTEHSLHRYVRRVLVLDQLLGS